MNGDAMKNKYTKHITRIALAQQAFLEAEAAVNYLLDSKQPLSDHLPQAVLTGMATTYCRPFTAGEGLGPLGREFSTFKDTANPNRFAGTHQMIWDARNKMLAHLDLEFGTVEFSQKRYKLNPAEIVFHLKPAGYSVRTTLTMLPAEILPPTKELILLQLQRIDERLTECAGALLAQNDKRLGFYILK